MSLLGNIIWLVFGGWAIGLVYLIGGVILFPILPFLWPMVCYAFWPFGREAMSLKVVDAYKVKNNIAFEEDKFSNASQIIRFIGTTVWILTFGWILAILHIVSGLINLFLCIGIVTIPVCLPNMYAHFKLVPVAFRPLGVKLIPSSLADEIKLFLAKSDL